MQVRISSNAYFTFRFSRFFGFGYFCVQENTGFMEPGPSA